MFNFVGKYLEERRKRVQAEKELQHLKDRISDRVSDIEPTKRVEYKFIAWAIVHFLDGKFSGWIQSKILATRYAKYKDLINDEIDQFFKGNSHINPINKDTLKRANRLLFYFLNDDNAYAQLFERIVNRLKKGIEL